MNKGEIIILKWIGDSRVPKYLSGTKAEVLEITKRGNYKVKSLENDSIILSIDPEKHIYKGGISNKHFL